MHCILGFCTKLQKSHVEVLSVWDLVSVPKWLDRCFYKSSIWGTAMISWPAIPTPLKLDKNNTHFTWTTTRTSVCMLNITQLELSKYPLEWKIFQTKDQEKHKTSTMTEWKMFSSWGRYIPCSRRLHATRMEWTDCGFSNCMWHQCLTSTGISSTL